MMNPTNPTPSDLSWDEIRQMIRETSIQMKETDRLIKETDQLIKETGLQMKETDRQMKESDLKFEKMREELRELSTRFTSQSGHIIEGLMEPSAIKIFQDRGYDINRCWKNFKKYNKSVGRKLEVDLLLLDDEIAIIVEVKINCTCKDVDHFTEQMRHFKEVCPEYANKKILLAMAAINYERDSDNYAKELGLFVIRVSNNNIFSLDPNDKEKMLVL
jgi:hypothetical protein